MEPMPSGNIYLPTNKVEDPSTGKDRKAKMMGEPFKHDPDFKGPIQSRSCTDCLCLILYLVFAVASLGVAIFAFARGNPVLLMYPTDSQGKVCGYGEMSDKPNLKFHDLLQCVRNLPSLIVNGCPTTQQCVKSCPTTTWTWVTLAAEEATYGIDVPKRKSQLLCVDMVDFGKPQWATYKLADLVQDGYCAPYLIPEKPVVYRCMPAFLVDTATNIYSTTTSNQSLYDGNGNVVTETALGASKEVYSALMKVQSWGDHALADIRASWPHMVIFGVIALFIAFMWIVLLRLISGVIIWTTIILFVLMWVFGTAFCFWRYNLLTHLVDFTPPSSLRTFTDAVSFQTSFDNTDLWLGVGITCAIILLVCLIVLCFLGSRIVLAIKLFQETSRALGHMPSVLFWPIIPFAVQLGTAAWAVAAAVCLATLGRAQYVSSLNSTYQGLLKMPDSLTSCDYSWALTTAANAGTSAAGTAAGYASDYVNTNGYNASSVNAAASTAVAAVNTTLAEACRFLKYGGAEYAVYFQLFNAFMFFWNFNFVSGFGIVTLAGAFASYYWAFKKPDDIPKLPLWTGLWRTMRYHMGSVAFGSLLIAIVQLIRLILDYIMYKMKKQKNHVAALIVKCIDCCFACIEKLVKFVARKAFIMVAVHGKNFCASALEGWQLIMRNAVRAVVLTGVSRFLIILSKLIVTGGMIVFAYFYFHGEIPAALPALGPTWPVLNYFYVPVVIVSVASFVISSVCFHVYEIGVETMFLAFLEDCERNDGSQERPYYMSKNLAACLR